MLAKAEARYILKILENHIAQARAMVTVAAKLEAIVNAPDAEEIEPSGDDV